MESAEIHESGDSVSMEKAVSHHCIRWLTAGMTVFQIPGVCRPDADPVRSFRRVFRRGRSS